MDKRNEGQAQKALDERLLKKVEGSCRISLTDKVAARKPSLNRSVSSDCLSKLPHDLSQEIPLAKRPHSFRCVNCPQCYQATGYQQQQSTCSTCVPIGPPSPIYSDNNLSLEDSESEYYPDALSQSQSSASWTELMNLGKEGSLSPQQSIDQIFSSEDEMSLYNPYHYQQTYGNGLKFQMEYFKRHSPLPTAGNDNAEATSSGSRLGSVGCSPSDSPSSSPPSPDALSSMPKALRRVKSLVMDGGLVETVTTKLSLNQVPSMRSHSPLISEQDAASLDLKVSPRVASSSTKFSLRRSASNISVRMTPFKRGGVPLVKPCLTITEGDETAESSQN